MDALGFGTVLLIDPLHVASSGSHWVAVTLCTAVLYSTMMDNVNLTVDGRNRLHKRQQGT